MLNQTISANTARSAYEDTVTEAGYDLAKLDAHGDSCPHCTKWAGKVISITGATKGYPTQETLIADGVFIFISYFPGKVLEVFLSKKVHQIYRP